MSEIHPRRSEEIISDLDFFIRDYNSEALAIRNLSAVALRHKLRNDTELAEIYEAEAAKRTLDLPR